MLIARLFKVAADTFRHQRQAFGTSKPSLSLKEFLETPLKEGETRVAGDLL